MDIIERRTKHRPKLFDKVLDCGNCESTLRVYEGDLFKIFIPGDEEEGNRSSYSRWVILFQCSVCGENNLVTTENPIYCEKKYNPNSKIFNPRSRR